MLLCKTRNHTLRVLPGHAARKCKIRKGFKSLCRRCWQCWCFLPCFWQLKKWPRGFLVPSIDKIAGIR